MADPLNCPFCGSNELASFGRQESSRKSGFECCVGCRKCGSRSGWFADKWRAIKAWNRRTIMASLPIASGSIYKGVKIEVPAIKGDS